MLKGNTTYQCGYCDKIWLESKDALECCKHLKSESNKEFYKYNETKKEAFDCCDQVKLK